MGLDIYSKVGNALKAMGFEHFSVSDSVNGLTIVITDPVSRYDDIDDLAYRIARLKLIKESTDGQYERMRHFQREMDLLMAKYAEDLASALGRANGAERKLKIVRDAIAGVWEIE